VRRHTRLDTSGSQGDKEKTQKQTHAGIIDRQRQVTETVDDRQRYDRPVFAENSVRNDRAKNREEIDSRDELVKPTRSLVFIHDGQLPASIHQGHRHEHDQDGAHPIKTEPLGCFVPDDVWHAGQFLVRRRAILRFQRVGCGIWWGRSADV
jgi:hypothetical protein